MLIVIIAGLGEIYSRLRKCAILKGAQMIERGKRSQGRSRVQLVSVLFYINNVFFQNLCIRLSEDDKTGIYAKIASAEKLSTCRKPPLLTRRGSLPQLESLFMVTTMSISQGDHLPNPDVIVSKLPMPLTWLSK